MNPEDQKPDDLQHLVAEEFRDKVAVIPVKSMRSGVVAYGLIGCGFGLVFGALLSEKLATGIGVTMIVAGFLIGRYTNWQEDKLIALIDSEKK